jgi:hypothetical protein
MEGSKVKDDSKTPVKKNDAIDAFNNMSNSKS